MSRPQHSHHYYTSPPLYLFCWDNVVFLSPVSTTPEEESFFQSFFQRRKIIKIMHILAGASSFKNHSSRMAPKHLSSLRLASAATNKGSFSCSKSAPIFNLGILVMVTGRVLCPKGPRPVFGPIGGSWRIMRTNTREVLIILLWNWRSPWQSTSTVVVQQCNL